MLVDAGKRRITVDDYHRMGDAGVLCEDDRVELIDGEILPMSPIGPPHLSCVDRANRALVLAAGERAIVRIQGSVRLSMFTEPQPDIVLLRPRADFYYSRFAGPDDILLIVEVADSSLEYDRRIKTRVYAEAGVREYWIADVPGGTVTCHNGPLDKAYTIVQTHRRGDAIAPTALPELRIRITDLVGE